jgi:hypothetical protein
MMILKVLNQLKAPQEVVPAELNITMKKVDAATASSRLEEILLWK